MSSESGGRGRGQGGAPGQQKVHEVRNLATGETRQVSQADWKDKAAYPRAEWERMDGVDEEAADATEGTDAGTIVSGDQGVAGGEEIR